jgi:hypothetical protein
LVVGWKSSKAQARCPPEQAQCHEKFSSERIEKLRNPASEARLDVMCDA